MKNLIILFFLVSSSLLFGQDGISQREAILQELLTLEIQLNNSITKIENLQIALVKSKENLESMRNLSKAKERDLKAFIATLQEDLSKAQALLVEQQKTLETHKRQLSELENSWIVPSLISLGVGGILGAIIGYNIAN